MSPQKPPSPSLDSYHFSPQEPWAASPLVSPPRPCPSILSRTLSTVGPVTLSRHLPHLCSSASGLLPLFPPLLFWPNSCFGVTSC